MAIPSISWNENGTFSVPNSPKASIKADADIWATSITAVPTVTPNAVSYTHLKYIKKF